MKKIAIASAAMGGAALIAFGASGTFASFTDEAVTTGSAGAGTLVITASESIQTDAQSVELAPGETTRLSFPVENGGSIDGSLSAVGSVDEAPDGCESASERNLPGGCAGDGQFSTTADVAVYLVEVERAAECGADTSVAGLQNRTAGWKMSQLNGAGVPDYPLAAGDVLCYIIDVSLDDEVGNVVQGDEATLSVELTLEQGLPAV
ncbi:TasA family protein [Blastococcus sp. SYSU D00813]